MPNNTTVNKVIINGVTKIDLTGDTATPSDVAQGKTFHDAAGILQTGTASGGGGDSWSWMGKNPTKVSTPLYEKVFLKDTPFATWTPSTTSLTLAAARNSFLQYNYNKQDCYIVLCKFHSHLDYNAGTTGKGMTTDVCYSYCYVIYWYYNAFADMSGNAPSKETSLSSGLKGGLFYKNSSGADAYYSGGTYGVYIATPPSVSWGSGYFSIGIPSINARCSNTYLTTANCALVNQDTSFYEYRMELWKVDRQTGHWGALYEIDRDMWLNGGTI